MIRRGVDSTNGGICVRQSPKEGLEVRSFRMVERPSDLGASVGVSQKPAGVLGDEGAKSHVARVFFLSSDVLG
jgi:hypothetical protein